MKKSIDLAKRIAEVLDDRKAQNILCLDVRHLTIITDIMLIASARSTLAVKALSDIVDEKIGPPTRLDGYRDARWIVMDYGEVLVHIFHEEEREFYQLERLWTDGSNEIEMAFD